MPAPLKAPALRHSPQRVYATAFTLGFGLLLPWYAFLNALPYFAGVFPSQPVTYWATIAFNSPQLPAQLALLATGKWPSPRLPLLVGYGVQAAVLLATPFLATRAVPALLVLAAVAGGATAVVESGVFGGCAELGANAASASQAVLAGEGVASVVANVVQLVLYTAPPARRTALTYAYFAGAAGVMCVCAALAGELAAQVAAQRARDGLGGGGGGAAAAEDAKRPLVSESTPLFAKKSERTPLVSLELSMAEDLSVDESRDSALDKTRRTAVDTFGADAPSLPTTFAARVAAAAQLALDVAAACWPTLLAIWGSMVLTFLVFPGVTADVPFTASDGGRGTFLASDKGAWSLLLFFVNAVGDLTGRALAGTDAGGFTWLGGGEFGEYEALESEARSTGGPLASADRRRGSSALLMRRVAVTLGYNAARALTLPVLIAAARGWRPPHLDVIVALNMVLFSVSNGHAQTLAMMLGPLQVVPEHRGTAAVLHVLCLIAGLWVGSAGALFLG
jgi:hypothetical protein